MFRIVLLVATAAACSSTTPGAHPHDMSAAQHDRTAGEHERAGAAHAGLYDANARAEVLRCTLNRPEPRACWTQIENPTAEHQRLAEEHRRRAADHRAASAALLDAEVRVCVGLDEDDRDTSPFDRVEDIARVDALREDAARKLPSQRIVGATVTFRARPGMTAEWLQRLVDCHLARNAALGHVVPEMPNCPLVPRGVRARVTSTGNGFAVVIRADDLAVAREILARARRSLMGPVTTSSR